MNADEARGPSLRQTGRWLVAEFAAPQRMASWAVVHSGMRTASRVGWYFVQKDELRDVRSPARYLRRLMAEAELPGTVAMMTGRRLHAYAETRIAEQGIACHVVMTAGMSNALRAGDPVSPRHEPGTINILCWLSTPLSAAASLEALALVSEARTAAVLECGVPSIVSRAPATGTGTDCIVMASPAAPKGALYAGKHLVSGHLVGAAVYATTLAAVKEWQAEVGGYCGPPPV